MPSPTEATYSVPALVAAHTSFRDLIDGGSGVGSIAIRDADDVLLVRVPLTSPCGTIDSTTGQLTLTSEAADDPAVASGTAAYGEFCDSDGIVYLSMPTRAGAGALAGTLTISALSIVTDAPIAILSATVG